MSNGVKLLTALKEGRLSEAREIVHGGLNEQRSDLIEGGKRFIAETLITDLAEQEEDNDEESDGEGDEYEDEDDEESDSDVNEAKIITKINSKGEKTKRKKAPEGYKYIDGKLTKISAKEKKNRSKGAKRGNKKKVGQRAAINRRTAKAKKKRETMGIK
jgi:hypothetical protein